jgi:hypothetical protein
VQCCQLGCQRQSGVMVVGILCACALVVPLLLANGADVFLVRFPHVRSPMVGAIYPGIRG